MAWWQTEASWGRHGVDRLFESHLKAHLIAPRDEPGARGRAVRGIRIRLREPQAFDRQTVHVGRGIVALAVAAHIGVAEIVRQNEDDVWPNRLGKAGAAKTDPRQSQRTCGCRLDKPATAHCILIVRHVLIFL